MSESQTGAGNHKFQSLNVIDNFENLAKWGQKTQPVQWYIWWPNDKVGPKITLSPTQPIIWYIWWPIQPLLWYIWWPTGKVGQK